MKVKCAPLVQPDNNEPSEASRVGIVKWRWGNKSEEWGTENKEGMRGT